MDYSDWKVIMLPPIVSLADCSDNPKLSEYSNYLQYVTLDRVLNLIVDGMDGDIIRAQYFDFASMSELCWEQLDEHLEGLEACTNDPMLNITNGATDGEVISDADYEILYHDLRIMHCEILAPLYRMFYVNDKLYTRPISHKIRCHPHVTVLMVRNLPF